MLLEIMNLSRHSIWLLKWDLLMHFLLISLVKILVFRKILLYGLILYILWNSRLVFLYRVRILAPYFWIF